MAARDEVFYRTYIEKEICWRECLSGREWEREWECEWEWEWERDREGRGKGEGEGDGDGDGDSTCELYFSQTPIMTAARRRQTRFASKGIGIIQSPVLWNEDSGSSS